MCGTQCFQASRRCATLGGNHGKTGYKYVATMVNGSTGEDKQNKSDASKVIPGLLCLSVVFVEHCVVRAVNAKPPGMLGGRCVLRRPISQTRGQEANPQLKGPPDWRDHPLH